MKKTIYLTLLAAAGMLLAVGCGKQDNDEGQQMTSAETQQEEQEEMFLPAEEANNTATIIVEYAEEEEYPLLAQFLASYYEIPEEYQTETRYYYNRIDLNEDGKDEIFAVVIGEYTEGDAGDPGLLLTEEGDDFTVLETFEEIRTPVTVSENMTNGWHDIILQEYGKGVETGYMICHYNPEGGYQTESNEFSEEKPSV